MTTAASFAKQISERNESDHQRLSAGAASNNASANHSNGRFSLRRALPALRFLNQIFDLSEDHVGGKPAARAGSAAARTETISVNGSHLWLPSMPTVHRHLRRFLAQSG
jgi:hypothetical protein